MTTTKGPWLLTAGRNIVTPSGTFFLTYGKDRHGNPYFTDFVELDNNAALIAEAGTVAHETGKTPRQLQEENQDLLEALKAVKKVAADLRPYGEVDNAIADELERYILPTLAKAEGKAQPYNGYRIAWELERTALGDGFYGNALRVAKDIPGITADDRSLLDRYATGRHTGTDHVKLQDLALRIDAIAKAEGKAS